MTPQSIDINSLPVLETGTLKTNGESYSIVLLEPQHLAAIKALHDAIIDALPPSEQAFILRKSEDYFAQHFQRGGGNAILGIVSGGKLIAQALIAHPDAAHPETGMVDMPPPGEPESLSLLQAVSTLPLCRGCGLMNRMVEHWIDHAQAHGRAHLVAEIDVKNQASWRAFLHGGLTLESIGRDPADGTVVYNAHEKTAAALAKRLTPVFNAPAKLPEGAVPCPPEDLARQKELMEAGFAAVAYDAAQKRLVMAPRGPA